MKLHAVALVTAGVLVLAGCGSGGKASGAAPAGTGSASAAVTDQGFNDTDVMFLQMMVPHHGQGIEIVRLAKDRATRGDVRMLAAAIETTQATEVQTMSGWLRDWRKPPTADPNSHAAHGGMPGTGAAEIANLGKATGADFERTFLNMMIAHQDDAIQIARMEVAAGTNTQAKDLARQIDKSRTAQIQQMLKYLGPS